MENALAVANYFLGKSFETGEPVTPMKLVKLVYIAHGWHLALTGRPLIAEPVQAWKYGPVIDQVYHRFKKFGGDPIIEQAHFLTPGGQTQYFQLNDFTAKDILDRVWEVYSNYDGVQLSALTHQSGTPWDVVWNGGEGTKREGVMIPNELIRQHYAEKADANRAYAA